MKINLLPSCFPGAVQGQGHVPDRDQVPGLARRVARHQHLPAALNPDPDPDPDPAPRPLKREVHRLDDLPQDRVQDQEARSSSVFLGVIQLNFRITQRWACCC